MSSDPKMPLGGAKCTFPLFPCLLCCDLPLNVVFFCFCSRYRPISRVIRCLAEPRIVPCRRPKASEPPMPAPVLCGNAFAALSEESLYDSPLDLGLSVEALAEAPVPRARRHGISSAGIGAVCSRVDAQAKPVPVNSSGPGAEVNPVKPRRRISTLTRCQGFPTKRDPVSS